MTEHGVANITARQQTDDGGHDWPALEAAGVSVHFGGLAALTKVNIQVAPGATIGLIGPNGAGKTTMLSVFSGLIAPSAGSVHLQGVDVTRRPPNRRAHLGLSRTYQQVELFAELTVAEHIRLGYRSHYRQGNRGSRFSLPGRAKAGEDAVVAELLDELALTDVSDRPAGDLPIGTCRLVELARAIATSPRVLLLDEPSSGLDSGETDRFCESLQRFGRERGIAMLLVEHNFELVSRVCQSVVVLEFGHVIANGPPAEIARDDRVLAAYLGKAS